MKVHIYNNNLQKINVTMGVVHAYAFIKRECLILLQQAYMLIYTYIINIVIRQSFSPTYMCKHNHVYVHTCKIQFIFSSFFFSIPLAFQPLFFFFPVRHYFPCLFFLQFAFLATLAAYRGTYHLGWKITSRLSDTNHLFEARLTINFAYHGLLKKYIFFYKMLQIIYARQIFTMHAISIDQYPYE